jgi:hypothetical protein
MKILSEIKKFEKIYTWEEKSGLLDFISTIRREINTFNEHFEFNIRFLTTQLSEIDEDKEELQRVGFVLIRSNSLVMDKTYCLYSVLRDKKLYGYIGIYKDSSIRTLRELKPIHSFKEGHIVLYDWLRQLVRASCEKWTL